MDFHLAHQKTSQILEWMQSRMPLFTTLKHDFHDYIHTITQLNKIHYFFHFDTKDYKNGINNGFDSTTIVFL
jgi:hypothetical protein